MAINQQIAQGLAPIGRDLPEIGNMLMQRRQAETRNALAEQAGTTDRLNAEQYRRSLDMQSQVREQDIAAQRKREARDWLTANYDRIRQQPQMLPKLVQFAKQNGYLDPAVPDDVPLEEIAGMFGVQAPQAPVQLETRGIPGNGIVQRDPVTGKLTQVVAPDRSDPRPTPEMFAPVDLDNGNIGAFDRRTGKVVDTGQRSRPKAGAGGGSPGGSPGAVSKPLPIGALRLVDDAKQAIAASKSSMTLVDGALEMLKSGKVQLGLVENKKSEVRNKLGKSDDNSRAFANIKQTLEKLRNNYLLLSKGVQTEGDAQRAWNSEIGESVENDNNLAIQQIGKAKSMIEQAIQSQQERIDGVYANYGSAPPEPAGGVVVVNSVEEAMALPSGTRFKTPDGRIKVRP